MNARKRIYMLFGFLVLCAIGALSGATSDQAVASSHQERAILRYADSSLLFDLRAMVPFTTPTPFPSSTPYPFTSTPTPTPTFGAPCGVLPDMDGETSCTLPSSFDYAFSFYVESGCTTSSTGTGVITFEVSTDGSQWTVFDTQYQDVTFPHGPAYVPISGTLNESNIPGEYAFYRIGYSAALSNGTHAYGLTRTNTICTAKPCTISFSDVDQSNPFYTWIRCLACRAIVSGYADGTFRPNNDITRGQIAKIVSNAAGFDDDPGPQFYEDVDPAHPFFPWINRLSHRGYMGGYPCGAEGEPCNPPDNRPYFRPSANATRGQLSKIVSNAAGYNDDIPPDRQTFAGVPPGSPFWLYIERLALHDAISGYPCGGPGEPCDDQQRPYFRPNNNVTRGQASKIVANVFFPNCVTP